MQRHVTHINKIKKFIKQKRVRFLIGAINNPAEHGLCLISKEKDDDIIIVLDPEKEFLATLIHECLHGIHPTYTEKKILSLENCVMKGATSNQFKSILFCFGKHAKLLPRGVIVEDVV